MFLDPYHRGEEHKVCISAEQGSQFAKTISNDFNPIHDPENKRFCVPGDLLFALVLSRYGLSQKMQFRFSGMVSADTELSFPEDCTSGKFEVIDGRDKSYLHVEREGNVSRDASSIEALVRNYVRFSGQNFPHILVPLMAEKNVMINPQRSLVVYEGMSFELETLEFHSPVLELERATLDIDGKRGEAKLFFTLTEGEKVLGHGMKTLLLSGLREYDQTVIDKLCEDYLSRQANYAS